MNRIIVVDDESDILDILRENLERPNLDVLTAQSGKEALKLLKMAPIDIVISDVMMPEMSGLELAEKITEQQGRAPYLIYITASSIPPKDLYAAGADACLPKPIDLDLLASMVEHFIKRNKQSHILAYGSRSDQEHLEHIIVQAQSILQLEESKTAAENILKRAYLMKKT
ncbi:response regulator [bacterium]|nr:response regulator [bacterium]